MTQRVGRDRFGDPGLVHVFAKDLPGAHARQWLSARVEEQDPLALPLLQLWAELAQIDRNRANCAATDGNEALIRVAHDVSLPEPEFEVSANGRHVPPDRCGRQSEVLEMIYEFAEQACSNPGRRRRALDASIGDEPGDVPLVGTAGLYRSTLLESEEIVEPLDVERAGHGVIQLGVTHVFFAWRFHSQIPTARTTMAI